MLRVELPKKSMRPHFLPNYNQNIIDSGVLIPKNPCCQIIRGNKKGKELKRKLLLWRWGGVGEDLGGGDAPTIQLQQPPSSSSHLLLLHLLLLLLQLLLHLLLLLISSILPRSPPPSSARQPWGIAADNQCSWLEDCWTFVSHCPPIRPPTTSELCLLCKLYTRIELDSFVNSSLDRLKLNPPSLHNWAQLLNLLHLCSAHFITSKDLAFWSIVFHLESYCVCM